MAMHADATQLLWMTAPSEMATQAEKFCRNLKPGTLPWLVLQTLGHAVLSSHAQLCYHNLAGTMAHPNYTTVPSMPTAAHTKAVIQIVLPRLAV